MTTTATTEATTITETDMKKTFVLTLPADIAVFASKAEAVATVDASKESADCFSTAADFRLLCKTLPMSYLVEMWNSLSGVTPVKKFADRGKASKRIWDQIQNLQPELAKPKKGGATKGGRHGSKKVMIIAMMQRPSGALRSEIMKATCWQQHTVRGFMAILKSKAGLNVVSAPIDGGGDRIYSL